MFLQDHARRCDCFLIIWATLLSCLVAAIVPAAPAAAAVAAPFPRRVWLPMVSEHRPPAGCAPNAQEAAIANYLRTTPGQARPSLTCNPILASVARGRAADMARRRYFGHVNPDGYAANYLVRQAGYSLPDFYDQSPTGNNIEAIAAGQPTAAEAWAAWMASPEHRTQLLGLDPFFAEQTDYGVGYAHDPASPYGDYWVVITARH